MSILNQLSSITIYDDASVNNNPQQRLPDWNRKILGETVQNPQAQKFKVLPGATSSLFSGTRATGIDNTSSFSLGPAVEASTYIVYSDGGTEATFRTKRNLTFIAETLTFTVDNNAVMSVTPSANPTGWSTAIVGDWFYISDANIAVDPVNWGFWVIIGITTALSGIKTLNLVRRTGEAFIGVNQSSISAAPEIFSSAGVQIGDSLELSAGFSSVSFGNYQVISVLPSKLTFFSSKALPGDLQVIPSTSGLTVYTSAKRLLRIESDQELIIRLNGDTNSHVRISPRTSGTSSGFGWIELWGPVWQLDVVNRSSVATANVFVLSAE